MLITNYWPLLGKKSFSDLDEDNVLFPIQHQKIVTHG